MPIPGTSDWPAAKDELNVTAVTDDPETGVPADDNNKSSAALMAMQNDIGITGTTDPTTLRYRLAAAEAAITDLQASIEPNRTPSSSAGANAWVAVAGPGWVDGCTGFNSNRSVRYLLLFNKATTPVNGDAALFTFQIAASNGQLNGDASKGEEDFGKKGIYFGTGIAAAFSTTPGTLTLATASDHTGTVIKHV